MAGDIDTFIGKFNRPQAKKHRASAFVTCWISYVFVKSLSSVSIWHGINLFYQHSPHLETIWFVNEDDDIKDKFLESCTNIKNFRYLTRAKGNYKYFFRLLYWYINQSTAESHTLIEEVKSSMHNMRIELNHIKGRRDEINI